MKSEQEEKVQVSKVRSPMSSLPSIPISISSLRRIVRSVALIVLLSADTAHEAGWSATVVALQVFLGIIQPHTSTWRRSGQQWVLDFPHGRLVANAELEVLLRNRIPVLVNHHHAEQHAKREDENAVDVVLDGVTNLNAEGEQNDLGDSKEGGAEQDVPNRPSVVQRPNDENQLCDDVDDHADHWPYQECRDCEKERNTEDDQTAESEELCKSSDQRRTADHETGLPRATKVSRLRRTGSQRSR